MNDIAAAFHEYFEIVTADTPELRKEVFSLRYRILCVKECIPGFETEKYPDELERDEYDNHSIHLLLKQYIQSFFHTHILFIFADQDFCISE